ncbi:MAG: hypothetical protein CMLOHMNK_02465 [Steroidobacteraceae bacterium]|nr:hypothetical protein [Steroidobacteraceae bacterium]
MSHDPIQNTAQQGTVMRKGISLRALAVASLALLPLTSLQARNIRVDFDPSAFESSGSGWSFSSINLFGPSALPGSGSLQFALSGSYDPDSDPGTNNDVSYDFQPVAPLQVGSSLYASFCMFANGTFTLSQSGDCSGSAGVDPTFGLLPIAGLSPREGAQPTDSGSMFSTNGFGVGIPDEGQPDFTGPYNIADAVPTVRLWWNDVAESYDEFGNAVGPSYSVQAFIYMLGDGNFDLDVRYGTNGGSFSGIERFISADGQSLFSDSTAVVEGGDYFYRFRNGQLQGGGTTGPPTSVPEPGSLALLSTGLIALAFIRRRRRKTA